MARKRKVLIAEDEILVREGLKGIVDWERLDMEIIGCAVNGKQALELYEKEHPDILLTDIRMPVMDGLELIAHIRERDKAIRIVILSCFEEFRYLQEAMRMEVSDYILKLKMKPAEIENAMCRLKEELFKEYIFYHQIPVSVFRSRVERMQISIQENPLLLCRLVLLEYKEVRPTRVDDGGMLARFLVLNMAEEIVRRYGAGELIGEREDCYLFLTNAIQSEDGGYTAPERLLREIARTLSESLNVRAVWIISSVAESWERLPDLYQECVDALEETWLGKDIVYAALAGRRALLWQRKTQEACRRIRTLLPWKEEQQEHLCALLTEQAAKGTLDKDSAERLLIEGLSQCGLEQGAAAKIRESGTFLEAVSVYTEACQQAQQQSQGRLSVEIYEALGYIDGHLEQKLSLQSVSGRVGLSPNYFSSLFKKEMDISFVDYVTQKRVERAKEMLMNTDLKTWEVAERTGFVNDSYFSRRSNGLQESRPVFSESVRKKEDSFLQKRLLAHDGCGLL
nr:response regulator [uncultured Acetatifactor sp.]